MPFQQNTSDNNWIFLEDQEKKKYESDEIALLKKKRRNIDIDIANQLQKRRDAAQRWDGHDEDKDILNDGMEISSSLHDVYNKPQHQINRPGPTTPKSGTAKVIKGRGLVFDWDNDIVDLRMKRSENRTIGGKPMMRTPKPMKLTVNLGDQFAHVNKMGGFKMNIKNPRPEKHTLDDSKLKNIGIAGINREAKKDKEEVNSLSSRLANMIKPHKKSGKFEIPGAKNLDFALVGKTEGLNKKKVRRLL